MQLNPTTKQSLLSAATQVYQGYLSLDLIKEHTFSSDKSLESLYKDALSKGAGKYEVTIDGHQVSINVEGSPEAYKVTISANNTLNGELDKPPAEYTSEDTLALVHNRTFTFCPKEGTDDYFISTEVDRHTIGGAKMSLYRQHLVTLHNIITKIESEQDISSLLVALATGSGKTFVQALWLLTLDIAKINSIFSVPMKLLPQFKGDLKKLLPNTFVDQLGELNSAESTELVDLGEKESTRHVLAATEVLLDNHYTQLQDLDHNKVFLSIDEQHLVMNQEARRVRLKEVASRLLTMFLSATPNEETYEMCGRRPVAIMSSGQKAKAGNGQFPQIFQLTAENISDRNARTQSNWLQKMLRQLGISAMNNIEQERDSAARTLVEQLPSLRSEDKQRIASRKMLVILDDNEELINLMLALKRPEDISSVYRNGNYVPRSTVYDFFGVPDVDAEVDRLLNGYTRDTLHSQLKLNVQHGVIEWYLSDLTGLSSIELNLMRQESPDELVALLGRKLSIEPHATPSERTQTTGYYRRKLKFNAKTNPNGIDAKGADELVGILHGIHVSIRSQKENRGVLHEFAMNDYEKPIAGPSFEREACYQSLRRFAETHAVHGLMSGMGKSEMPVDESRPFMGLSESRAPLYDGSAFATGAKQRSHTAIEILDDTTYESTFHPNYLMLAESEREHQEVISDNYFRLGFAGMYVSNKKTEGFSDPHLHTVINIADQSTARNNRPDTLIQGIGRNRGLDQTRKPAYVYVLGRNASAHFDLDHLNSDDYYPALHKAQRKFKKAFLKGLGEEVGTEVIQWISANMNDEQKISKADVERQIHVLVLNALREINNVNAHDIKLSRNEMRTVLRQASKTIQAEIHFAENPYKMTPFIKGLAGFLSFVTSVYYLPLKIMAGAELLWRRYAGDPNQADKIYFKLISAQSFQGHTKRAAIAKEYQNWMRMIASKVEFRLTSRAFDFAKDSKKQEIEDRVSNHLIPLLLRFVDETQRTRVERSLRAYKKWPYLLSKHSDAVFSKIGQHIDKQDILALLHDVRGLETIQLTDLSTYGAELEHLVQSVTTGSILAEGPVADVLAQSLSEYLLSDEFKACAHGFFPIDQHDLLCAALADDAKRTELSQYLVSQLATLSKQNDPMQLLLAVNNAFNLNLGIELVTLDQRKQSCDSKLGQVLNPSGEGGTFKDLFRQAKSAFNLVDDDFFIKEMLPLCASFIKPEYRKAWLDAARAKKPLSMRFARKQKKLMALQQAPLDLSAVRVALNDFAGVSYSTDAFIDPIQFADDQTNKLLTNVKERLVSDLFRSDAFKQQLSLIYRDDDCARIQVQSQQDGFVDQLFNLAGEPLAMLQGFEALISGSKPETPCSSILTQVDAFRDCISNENSWLDKQKMSQYISEQIAPVLFESRFKSLVEYYFGPLSEEDITYLCEDVMEWNSDDNKAINQHILTLIKVIRSEDRDTLRDTLCKLSDESTSMDNLPLKQAIERLGDLVKELIEVRAHFNHCNNKGMLGSANSKLYAKCTSLGDIQTFGSYDFFPSFARKIKFIRGIQTGLPEASAVNAKANANRIRVLKRVNRHIVDPLAERIGRPTWRVKVIDAISSATTSIRHAGYRSVTQLKKGVAGLFKLFGAQFTNGWQFARKRKASADYQADSRTFAREVNQLERLGIASVTGSDCPLDAIDPLMERSEAYDTAAHAAMVSGYKS